MASIEHPAGHPGSGEAGQLGVTGEERLGAGAEREVGVLLREHWRRLEISSSSLVSLDEMLR